MYCPNCGKETSVELKFCRSCGLGLETIAQSVAEQFPTKLDENLKSQKEEIERRGVIALGIFGLGIVLALLYLIVYRVMLVQGRVFEGIAILVFMALISCGLYAVYLFAKANEVEADSKKRRAGELDEAPGKINTAKLLPEGYLEPVPGVTERTTDLLFAERRGRTKES